MSASLGQGSSSDLSDVTPQLGVSQPISTARPDERDKKLTNDVGFLKVLDLKPLREFLIFNFHEQKSFNSESLEISKISN